MSRRLILILAVPIMAVVIVTIAARPTVAADTANLWVVPSGGVSPCFREPTAIDFEDAPSQAKCGSLNAAYQASNATTDIIKIKGGNYGDQQVLTNASAGSPGVTFRAAAGETPTYGVLNFEHTDYWNYYGPALITHHVDLTSNVNAVMDGVTVDRSYANQAGVDGVSIAASSTKDANNVTFRNSDVCCNLNRNLISIDDNGGDISNVTISGNDIHDGEMVGSGIHMICLWVTDVNGITIRNNRLWGCHGTGDLELSTSQGENKLDQVVVENNVFEKAYGEGKNECCGVTAWTVQSAGNGDLRSSVWRHNIFETPAAIGAPPAGSTALFAYNLGKVSACNGTRTAYLGNIWADASCPGDKPQDANALAAGRFIESTTHDWSPVVGAAQIDMAESTCAASTLTICDDLTGSGRNGHGALDVGPYEYGVGSGPLIGDIDVDGDIDTTDLNTLKADYGKTTSLATTPTADLNDDSKINVIDLSILLRSWSP